MKYDILKWLESLSNNTTGDTYAHVSYKRIENGKTVEDYEKKFVNGELVDEKKKTLCECGKDYQTLKDENKELKERVYDLEKEKKRIEDELYLLEKEKNELKDENRKLSEKLDEKNKQLESIKKAPICGGFMVSDEDMKNGNIEEMFRQAGEYMQNILKSRMDK